MKQNKNIFPSLSSAAALLIATMFASCTKAELEAPVVKQGDEIRFGIEKNGISKPITKSGSKSDSRVLVDYDPNDPCSLGLSVTVVDGIETPKSHLPATKGAQVSQKEQLTAFDVVSYFYADEAAEDGAFVFEDIVSDGVNTTKTYYWPSFGEMNFIATYPAGMFGEDGIKSIADAYGHLQSFSYTIPETVANQQDIMIAVTNDVDCTEGAPVPLQFKHLLAAVQFKVGEMQFIKINSLKVTGVYGGEITFTYDSDDNVWTPSVSTTSSYDLSSIIMDTSGLVEGDDITSTNSNSIMLVAPQILPAGAQLEVSWTETITGLSYTKTAPLSGVWEAGKTTVYALNIAGTDFGTVVIPRPDDQDAHYIMLTMSYNMGNILSDGNIKSVKATAQWKKDENGKDISGNNSDKSGISLKHKKDLTETQKDGYWTDKRLMQTITVSSTSQPQYSEIKEYTELDSYGNSGIRGGSYVNISDAEDYIVLFIEENNGITDRVGELVFTATLKTDVEIILGKGEFKQLCPSWNDEAKIIGVERIEDSDESPYGFKYNRVVSYSNPGLTDYSWSKELRCLINQYNLGLSATENGFISLSTTDVKIFGFTIFSYITQVTFNYGALNNVSGVASDSDGLKNTNALYDFTGNTNVNEMEIKIKEAGWPVVEGSESGEVNIPANYAAYLALVRNRMCELKTTIKSSGGDDRVSYKAILHTDSAGNEIIEWYLPSSEEAKTLHETGTAISPLNGEYWSSTAGDDNNACAHSYTYTNNEFGSINTTKGRMENLKVRAVRKKPIAN